MIILYTANHSRLVRVVLDKKIINRFKRLSNMIKDIPVKSDEYLTIRKELSDYTKPNDSGVYAQIRKDNIQILIPDYDFDDDVVDDIDIFDLVDGKIYLNEYLKHLLTSSSRSNSIDFEKKLCEDLWSQIDKNDLEEVKRLLVVDAL